jgi:hypothetical protein
VTGSVTVMAREGAVGWRDIPLDGMTCYHRCVEAVLRGAGWSAAEIVEEMGGPITSRFHRDGRPQLRLRRGAARWLIAPEGDSHWALVAERMAAGRPVLLWPDGYFWPGDRYEGRRHIYHHAVLATEIDGDTLRFLDIDAGEAGGFRAGVPVTEKTRKACTRVLDLDVSARGRPLRAADVDRMIASSVQPLSRLAQGTADLAGWWRADPTRRLAHAVDLFALGDVQPQVYLFAALCERFHHAELAALGYQAAATAKKISLFLFSLHAYKPIAPYALCLDDIESLARKLHAMRDAAARAAAVDVTATGSGSWLWHRLNALSRWHFDVGIGTRPEHVAVHSS